MIVDHQSRWYWVEGRPWIDSVFCYEHFSLLSHEDPNHIHTDKWTFNLPWNWMQAVYQLVSIPIDLSQKDRCSFYWWKKTMATFFWVVLVARLATINLALHHRGMHFDWKLSLHRSKHWTRSSFGLTSSSSPSTRKTATVLSFGLVWRTLCLKERKWTTREIFLP